MKVNKKIVIVLIIVAIVIGITIGLFIAVSNANPTDRDKLLESFQGTWKVVGDENRELDVTDEIASFAIKNNEIIVHEDCEYELNDDNVFILTGVNQSFSRQIKNGYDRMTCDTTDETIELEKYSN